MHYGPIAHGFGNGRHQAHEDVDAIVDVTSYAKYAALSEAFERWG